MPDSRLHIAWKICIITLVWHPDWNRGSARGNRTHENTGRRIDFGTSKIVTLIAQSGGVNRCDIIGSGTVPYDGFAGATGTRRSNFRAWRAIPSPRRNWKPIQGARDLCGRAGRICACAHRRGGDHAGRDGRDLRRGRQPRAGRRGGGTENRRSGRLCDAPLSGVVCRRRRQKNDDAPGRARRTAARAGFLCGGRPAVCGGHEKPAGRHGIAILGFLSPTLGESLLLLSLEDRDPRRHVGGCGLPQQRDFRDRGRRDHLPRHAAPGRRADHGRSVRGTAHTDARRGAD